MATVFLLVRLAHLAATLERRLVVLSAGLPQHWAMGPSTLPVDRPRRRSLRLLSSTPRRKQAWPVLRGPPRLPVFPLLSPPGIAFSRSPHCLIPNEFGPFGVSVSVVLSSPPFAVPLSGLSVLSFILTSLPSLLLSPCSVCCPRCAVLRTLQSCRRCCTLCLALLRHSLRIRSLSLSLLVL